MYECGTPEYNRAVRTKGSLEYIAARTRGTAQWQYHDQIYRQAVAERERRWKREDRRSGVKGFFGGVWHLLVGVGMMSSDPTLARQAIVIRAQEELKNQRRIAEINQQGAQLREERQARLLARAMVDEMEARRRV